MKKDTKKCLCDEPTCVKCLMVNCEDDTCSIHTQKTKDQYRKIKVTYIQPDKPNEEKINKAFEILFEEVSKIDDEDLKN